VYEDIGILTADPAVCAEVAAVFNALTGNTPYPERTRMLIAPVSMRDRFFELIRREAEHAQAGRPCGIYAKMNQLQDPEVIRELYRASQAGVPSRSTCAACAVSGRACRGCPRPSASTAWWAGSSNIPAVSVRQRGNAEYYIGSADWMHRNLTNRIETVVPVQDPALRRALDEVIEVYETDNCSAWTADRRRYVQRRPAEGAVRRARRPCFSRGGRRRERTVGGCARWEPTTRDPLPSPPASTIFVQNLTFTSGVFSPC